MKNQDLDLTLVNLTNKHSEIEKRNEKAKAYSSKCSIKNKRKANLYDVFVIICLCLFSIGIWFICDLGAKAKADAKAIIESATEMETENMLPRTITKEETFEFKRLCLVTEVNGDLVTVEYKGNHYDFFGDDFHVGDEIFCTFTEEWEIVDAFVYRDNTTHIEEVVLTRIDENGNYILENENYIFVIEDAPEVWFTVTIDNYGNVVGLEEIK